MMDFNYITPTFAAEMGLDNGIKDIEHYEKLAALSGTCCNCDNPIWKVVNNDMCFCCTTGEADPSDDYELI